MIKLHTLFSKKVPGSEDYSSVGYQVSIESEVADEAIHSPNGLRQRIESMFDEARKSVDEEIAKDRADSPVHDTPGRSIPDSQPRSLPSQSNGQGASAKQIQFLISLATRQHGMTLDELSAFSMKEVGKDNLDLLTKRDASALIETLK